MSVGVVIIIILIGSIILLKLGKYQPWIDITKEGDVMLWYNDDGKRTYKKLFNISLK